MAKIIFIECTIWADGEETEREVDDIGQGAIDCPSDDRVAVYYKIVDCGPKEE
jgi:hypothetical protein